jgi:hypothetical protein
MKTFIQTLADNIEKETGEKPCWLTLPSGKHFPEPRQNHKARAKRLSQLIDNYRTPTTKMGDMRI